MSNNKKMSNFNFRLILILITAVLVTILIVFNVLAVTFEPLLDDWLGRGERYSVIPEGRDTWDTDYYREQYATSVESKEAEYKVALDVQREGAILLKNNGVLPLSAGSTVTPFGVRYKNKPVYGQTSESGSAKWVVDPVTPEAGLKDTFTINNAVQNKYPVPNYSATTMATNGQPNNTAKPTGDGVPGAAPNTIGVNNSTVWKTKSSNLIEYAAWRFSDDAAVATAISGTTALVFIGREGSEGADLKWNAYDDGTKHYFALSQNEKDAIKYAKTNCAKVVVILQAASAMEIPELMSGELEADAILLFGHAGERGYTVLGDILSGKVNPSGRTVAIWSSDFYKDPTYQNFGSYSYQNRGEITSNNYGRLYVEYDEDMYMGYRYYETAHDIQATGFTYGELDGKGAIKTAGAVEYPFGYGLSYTTFSQAITSYSDSGDSIKLTVKVTNTGASEGKEVVQIYYNPPYGQFDKDNKIEKPTKTLVAFGKTKLLKASESEDIKLEFLKEDIASYCATRDNGDGTKGAYVLSAGNYIISLQKNSHDIIESKTWNNPATTWFDSSNPRQSEKLAQSALDDNGNSKNVPAAGADADYQAAHNLFQDSTDYMMREGILTRANWNNTFPQKESTAANEDNVSRAGQDMTPEISELFQEGIWNYNIQTDAKLGNVSGSYVYHENDPVSAKDNGLLLSDLRGKGYYDSAWQEWLDQVDYTDATMMQQIRNLTTQANYATTAVAALGVPLAQHADGANGLKVNKTNHGMNLSATYGLTPLWAATYNTVLMKQLGEALGESAIKTHVSGWYAPAINLHRTPFSGRNFEYYSEDPVLTGKTAAAVVSGATGKGLYCYIKHFALNDQETNRGTFLSTWASEQTMREIYFKAYEIPVKEAMMTIQYTADENGNLKSKTMRASTAIMAAQSCIGQVYAHADYRLLTQLLRDEWGFKGTVTSDMISMNFSGANGTSGASAYEFAYRSGCDTWLPSGTVPQFTDPDSATTHWMNRRILHNVGYTIAHSNLMQSNPPGTIFLNEISPWKLSLVLPVNLGLAVLILGAVTWIVLRTLSEKKNPDQYERRNNGNGN